jgi:hypothetical protein
VQEAKDPLGRYRRTLLDRYAEQPQALRAAFGLWDSQLQREPLAPEEWSPHQIVTHVGSVETHAFLPRLKRILTEKDPEFEDWDDSAWLEDHYDPSEDGETWLEAFAEARREGLDLLGGLAEDGWNRTGRHPAHGERTLQWWLEYSVSHADDHIQQLQPAS